MKPKHTPGPWSIDTPDHLKSTDTKYIYGETRGWGRDMIAEVDTGGAPEREANVQLIASSPDLLKACLHAVARLRELDEYRKDDSSASIGLIQKAIDKATGGAE